MSRFRGMGEKTIAHQLSNPPCGGYYPMAQWLVKPPGGLNLDIKKRYGGYCRRCFPVHRKFIFNLLDFFPNGKNNSVYVI